MLLHQFFNVLPEFLAGLFRKDCRDGHLLKDGFGGGFAVEHVDHQATFVRQQADRIIPCLGVAVSQQQADLSADPPDPVIQSYRFSTSFRRLLRIRKTISPTFFKPPSLSIVRRTIFSRASNWAGIGK